MCFPRWDSDACFATLIGGQGTYAVTPQARFVWGGYYEHGLIWRSRWITDEGVVECREALALPGRPAAPIILRRIRVREGTARGARRARSAYRVRRRAHHAAAPRRRRTLDGSAGRRA